VHRVISARCNQRRGKERRGEGSLRESVNAVAWIGGVILILILILILITMILLIFTLRRGGRR
jgi:hypothetical protein